MSTDEPDSREYRANSREYDLGMPYHQNLDFLNNTSPVNSRIPLNEKIFQETPPKKSGLFYMPPRQKP